MKWRDIQGLLKWVYSNLKAGPYDPGYLFFEGSIFPGSIPYIDFFLDNYLYIVIKIELIN